jgi:hypothetical protein
MTYLFMLWPVVGSPKLGMGTTEVKEVLRERSNEQEA